MIRLLLSAGVFAADQYCKKRIEKQETFRDKKILGGRIIITRYYNEGAFLNWLSGRKKLLITATSLLTGGLILLSGTARSGWSKTGYALLTGGAASNLYDRCRKGYVTDYFSFQKIPRIVFNLGDLAIFAGTLLILPELLIAGNRFPEV